MALILTARAAAGIGFGEFGRVGLRLPHKLRELRWRRRPGPQLGAGGERQNTGESNVTVQGHSGSRSRPGCHLRLNLP
jgi:hypothetical protein